MLLVASDRTEDVSLLSAWAERTGCGLHLCSSAKELGEAVTARPYLGAAVATDIVADAACPRPPEALLRLNAPWLSIGDERGQSGANWLQFGAVDFVDRPLQPQSVYARLDARLRVPGLRPRPLRIGGFEYDPSEWMVSYAGRSVRLRRAEASVFQYLAARSPTFVAVDEIVRDVLDGHGQGASARTHVWALRRKLASVAGNQTTIESVRHRGYRLVVGWADATGAEQGSSAA